MVPLDDFLTRERIGNARRILDELLLLLDVDLSNDGIGEGRDVAEIRAALRFVAVEIADKVKAIESDRDLSTQGRAKAFAKLADSVRPRLANLQKAILPRLQAKLDNLRGELTEPLPTLSKDDSAGAIRQMEVRNRLHALDEGSRLSTLWRAVELGDTETLSAFIFAPKSFPLVDGEVLAQATDAHCRQQRPEIVEQLEVVETLVETLDSYFRQLSHTCDYLANLVADDPAGDGTNK